jgi:hypothetical protein
MTPLSIESLKAVSLNEHFPYPGRRFLACERSERRIGAR